MTLCIKIDHCILNRGENWIIIIMKLYRRKFD